MNNDERSARQLSARVDQLADAALVSQLTDTQLTEQLADATDAVLAATTLADYNVAAERRQLLWDEREARLATRRRYF